MDINHLAKRALENDEKAKDELIYRLRPLILSSIKRYGGLRIFDEDAYNEGVVVILEGLMEYDPHKGVPFLGFIKVKMKYHYFSRRRSKIELESLDQPVDRNGELSRKDLIVDKTVDILGDYINKEEVIHIKGIIKKLSHRQKQVIFYYYYENKTLKEIAEILNIHYVTVSRIKKIAIKKFKNIMLKPS